MGKSLPGTSLKVVAWLLFCCIPLMAQTITASINGTVTDSSGAAIVGAKVIAKAVETNVETGTVTDGDGVYHIRFLQIGHYTVTVDAPGFAAYTYGPFTLEVDQDAKIDAKLNVQSSQQQVSVQAEVAPLLNTENGALATTLDTRAIDNIPMIGRDYIQLTMFVPGAISTSPSGFAGNSAIGVGGNTVSVNGNRQQGNAYILDGVDTTYTVGNTPAYNMSPDAIEQLQIISANAPAEYGDVNGGDIIVITKSGTNQFHGSAFDYLSDAVLNANSWANKHTATVTPRSAFTQDMFGGTFGGPIVRDRLFFFGDFDGGRYHTGGAANVTVATAAERTGDFSALLDPALMCSEYGGSCGTAHAGDLIQLYDATNPAFPAYPDNQIPIVNPVAQYLFSHPDIYPLPNQAPAATDSPAADNYRGVSKSSLYNNQFDIKGDWDATDKDKLSIRYGQSNNGSITTHVLAISFPSNSIEPIHVVALNEIHTFNASMVNALRIGYFRMQPLAAATLDTTGLFGKNGDAVIGIPGIVQQFAGFSAQSFTTPASPSAIQASNGTEYTTMGNSVTGGNYTGNTFIYGDDFTWLKGLHTIKMGALLQRDQQDDSFAGNDGALGNFAYLGAGTSAPLTNVNGYNTKGYTMADFVLDRVSFVGWGGVEQTAYMRTWRDSYYIQDDWKATRNLTLNLGVRYEYDQPIYEAHNKFSSINLQTEAIELAGVDGASRSLVNPYYGGVMPRIGFSYLARPHFVIRGGYGIQNYMEGTGSNLRMFENPPFKTSYESDGSAPAAGNAGVFFAAQNGFSNPLAGAAPSGGTFNVWDPNIRPAFIGEYSLTTEYQVSNTASVQIGYVGESGQHLITANSANQLYQPCFVNGVLQTNTSTVGVNPLCLTSDPAPFQNTPGIGYNGTVKMTASNAMMNYNALQATFRQRVWHGLQYNVNYTYSHAFTNSTGFYGVPSVDVASAYAENVYNNHEEYGPAGQDVRHAANWNLVYDLPIGHDRMFGANMNRVLDDVVGGWRIAMTGVEYTGFPVTLVAANNTYVNNGGAQRANHYRTLKIVHRSINNWFGTDPSATPCTTPGVDNGVCAYGQPANGTFGTAPPDSERAPGFQQYDASVSKDFTTWHEQRFEFRVDGSNILNQTALGNPNNSITSTAFGQITSVRSGVRQLQLDAKYFF